MEETRLTSEKEIPECRAIGSSPIRFLQEAVNDNDLAD